MLTTFNSVIGLNIKYQPIRNRKSKIANRKSEVLHADGDLHLLTLNDGKFEIVKHRSGKAGEVITRETESLLRDANFAVLHQPVAVLVVEDRHSVNTGIECQAEFQSAVSDLILGEPRFEESLFLAEAFIIGEDTHGYLANAGPDACDCDLHILRLKPCCRDKQQ